jgi:tetratricopeptide (TPR) repeat protein
MFLLLSGLAQADHAADVARGLNDRAAGAYALGRFAEAADLYEQAFAAKPVPELLYNAAQAQRFAGNKTRALQLYENCLRVYADRLAAHRDDIEIHITELRFALAAPPLPSPAAQPAAPEMTPRAPVIAPPKAPPPLVLSDDVVRPKAKRRSWVWGVVVGATAAVGLAVGLGAGLSSRTESPNANLGTLKAQ